MAEIALSTENVIAVIADLQKMSGQTDIDISESTCPIEDLAGFDSIRGVEAIVFLEEQFGVTIKGEVSLFVAPDGTKSLNIREVTERINELLSPTKRK
jgi:acyl carrier protein